MLPFSSRTSDSDDSSYIPSPGRDENEEEGYAHSSDDSERFNPMVDVSSSDSSSSEEEEEE